MSSDIVIFKSFGAEDAFCAKARTASKNQNINLVFETGYSLL